MRFIQWLGIAAGICTSILVLEVGVGSDLFLHHLDGTWLRTKPSFRIKQSVSGNDTSMTLPSTGNGVFKPRFVLHVGPPKTGTTSIQNLALKYTEILEEDNVFYIGNAPMQAIRNRRFPWSYSTHEMVRKCRGEQEEPCSKAWKGLEAVLMHHWKLNHTVFLSEENFSSFTKGIEKKRLWNYLLPLTQKWQVHVVFTYRRYYETMSSRYYQQNNPNNGKEEFANWPNVGTEIPSFSSYVHRWEEIPFLGTLAVQQRWKDHFDHVSIFNFHSDGDLPQNFYCNMIPETPTLCKRLVSELGEADSVQQNPSSAKVLHHDMIATAAYKQGLIKNTTLSRAQVSKAIEEFATEHLGLKSLIQFPLKQLSNKRADYLLQHSLLVEKTMLPEFFSSPKGRKELVAGFDRYLKTGRLASVDTDQVLKDPKWKTFFSLL